jgi:hypothetical protein
MFMLKMIVDALEVEARRITFPMEVLIGRKRSD